MSPVVGSLDLLAKLREIHADWISLTGGLFEKTFQARVALRVAPPVGNPHAGQTCLPWVVSTAAQLPSSTSHSENQDLETAVTTDAANMLLGPGTSKDIYSARQPLP